MPAERTLVTELATGLGMLGLGNIDDALDRRPEALVNVSDADFTLLRSLRAGRTFDAEFAAAFNNGQAFLHSADALHGRLPRIVEWTGGRKAPGDETVPANCPVGPELPDEQDAASQKPMTQQRCFESSLPISATSAPTTHGSRSTMSRRT